MLEIRNLNVSYQRLRVLWDLCLVSREQEAVGIFGPNGAGKSTLINSIIGLIKAEKGEILYKDNPITGLETHQIIQQGIAVVPQKRELFPLMTVQENLKLGAAYIPGAREKIAENMQYIFRIFPILKERANQLAGTLSGGEQRMLTVGRALMSNPRLLILDEPSVGLQPSLVSELFRKLIEIKKGKVSIILAEQNVRQGLKLIDRGYVLENGRIVIEDDAKNLLRDEHIKKSYLGI